MKKGSAKFTQADLEKMDLIEVSPGFYKKKPKEGYIKGDTVLTGIKMRLKSGETKTVLAKEPIVIFSEKSVIEIAGIVAGLNGSKGLMRSHWSAVKRQKDLYLAIINDHLRANKARSHEGAVSIEYIGYKSVLMDWDNFCASFKHIGDALVKSGVIKEDSPKIVQRFTPEQIKCKRKEQKVVIVISDIK